MNRAYCGALWGPSYKPTDSQALSRTPRYTGRAMDKVLQVFHSFDDADHADEAYYADLTPQERVDILLDLVASYRESLGEAAARFERVYRVIELSKLTTS